MNKNKEEANHTCEKNTLPSTNFSTNNLLPLARIDAVRHLMSPLYDVQPLSADRNISAYMKIFLFGGLIFSKSGFSNHRCTRGAIKADTSESDGFLIQYFDRGCISGYTDNEKFTIENGEIAFFDLRKTYGFHVTSEGQTASLNLVIPRVLIEYGKNNLAHGSKIPSHLFIAKTIAAYLKNLFEALPNMDPSEYFAAQQMTVDIVNSGFKLLSTQEEKEYLIKEKISSYLFQNCAEDLSTDEIAQKFHISRATLFRIYSKEGGVMSYIKDIRLQHCLKDVLFSRHRLSTTELAVKWGFSSEQQMLRGFKRKYQSTPNTIRAEKINYFHSNEGGLYSSLASRSNFSSETSSHTA